MLFRAVIRGVHRHTLDANIYKSRDNIPTFEEKNMQNFGLNYSFLCNVMTNRRLQVTIILHYKGLYKCVAGIIILEAFTDDNPCRAVIGITCELSLPASIEPRPFESVSFQREYHI